LRGARAFDDGAVDARVIDSGLPSGEAAAPDPGLDRVSPGESANVASFLPVSVRS
jgi:hypothetical protein